MLNNAIEGVNISDAARSLFKSIIFSIVIIRYFNIVSRVKLKITLNASS